MPRGFVVSGGLDQESPGEPRQKVVDVCGDTVRRSVGKHLLQEARIGRPTLRDTRAELFLDVYRCARGKQVFSDDVKAGIALGEKLRVAAAAVREVEIYGNDDVAYGVRLSFPCETITVHRSDTVRAVLKGTDDTLEFTP